MITLHENFHVTHPYLIYVVDCIDVVIIDGSSCENCDKDRFGYILVFLMDQIV